MAQYDPNFLRGITKSDDLFLTCCGCPTDDELPQVEGQSDVLIHVIQQHTGQPFDVVENEVRHREYMKH